MKASIVKVRLTILSVAPLFGFLVAAAPALRAQGQGATGPMYQSPDPVQQLNRRSAIQQVLQVQGEEDAAYADFKDVKPGDVDKKIKLGEAFLRKYSNSKYAESVHVGLVNAYYAKQDWQNFYASADKALALNPDEIDVLVTVGWVIPHFYDRREPDADKLLEKAETYEKRAIPEIANMPEPPDMKDAQFSDFKIQKLNQAHSALGLVYFRRQDYDNAVKELQQATQSTATPDQADLFVLATSLDKLNRHAEAADSFDRCGQIPGGLQEQCKRSGARAKDQAAQTK